MKFLKTLIKVIADIVEIYLPCTTFSLMFLAFIIQIISRYLFNYPLAWAFEVTTFCFVWTVLFSALYAKRTTSHVKFTIFYDHLSSKTQLWVRICGNALIVFTLIAAFYPSWDYISFMSYKKSTILNIPYNIVYFPFMIFLTGMIIHFSIDIINDFICIKKETRLKVKNEHK